MIIKNLEFFFNNTYWNCGELELMQFIPNTYKFIVKLTYDEQDQNC